MNDLAHAWKIERKIKFVTAVDLNKSNRSNYQFYSSAPISKLPPVI